MVGGVFRLEKLVTPYTTYFRGSANYILLISPCYQKNKTTCYFFNAALGDNTITI